MDKHLEVSILASVRVLRGPLSLTGSAHGRQRLAEKHTDTLFLRADVANMPFLVNKLSVKVLPCVIGFAQGVSKMKYVLRVSHDQRSVVPDDQLCAVLSRLVGFDELEGGDDFNTKTLEIGMVHCGKITYFPV